MSKIQIVTDTDSNLPLDVAKENQIALVPITVQFGEESFQDLVEIKNPELFERIDKLGKLPTTAAPSLGAFIDAFRSAFEKGADSIVCVCVSSKVSRTYESALAAAEEFAGKVITVIDSESLSMSQGYMVISAARAAAAGKSHEEVVSLVQDLRGRCILYGSLSTLKYLALGGRVSNLAASMANMLNIRPILCVNNGKLDLLEKVRTRKVAMDRLVELLVNSVQGREVEYACLLHVLNAEDALELGEKLRTQIKMPSDIPLIDFGPGLSVHAGVGLIGAVIVTK